MIWTPMLPCATPCGWASTKAVPGFRKSCWLLGTLMTRALRNEVQAACNIWQYECRIRGRRSAGAFRQTAQLLRLQHQVVSALNSPGEFAAVREHDGVLHVNLVNLLCHRAFPEHAFARLYFETTAQTTLYGVDAITWTAWSYFGLRWHPVQQQFHSTTYATVPISRKHSRLSSIRLLTPRSRAWTPRRPTRSASSTSWSATAA